MNNTIKSPQKSSIPLNATGSCDNTPTNQNKSALSRITVNFGLNCQNKPNFAARVGLNTAQKIEKNQKTTAIKARRGFVLCN
jgi:hypothetical protein